MNKKTQIEEIVNDTNHEYDIDYEGYEDYGVSEFGGGDYEQTYNLDNENTLKLKHMLQVAYNGSLDEMIEAAFGKEFSDRKFWSLCEYKIFSILLDKWQRLLRKAL